MIDAEEIELLLNSSPYEEGSIGVFISTCTLVHREKGDYDEGKDGFFIIKDPKGQLWKLVMEEDSYSTGYLRNCVKVKEKTKTVTVWE